VSFARDIAIRTVFMEASGSGAPGMKAVCHVLWNRLHSGRWGSNLTAVCLWPEQFSCWNTSDPNRLRLAREPEDSPILFSIGMMLDAAANEADFTQGATHYYDPDSVLHEPPWAAGATNTGQWGGQLFFSGVK